MKVTEHVERLLRQGRKPKELIEFGFSKAAVTRARRRLKEEKLARQLRAPEKEVGREQARSSSMTPKTDRALQQKLGALDSKVSDLERRIKLLESSQDTGRTSLEEMRARLDGTPGLGLKKQFECECGASGLVALHIECTKCGKETWWGWFPKQ